MPLFREGIERIKKGAESYRVALVCAEKEPLECHRAILVCRHLRRPGLAIEHILADGSLESQHALEQRLLLAHGLQQTSFLDPRSPREAIEEAYDRQGAQIAYTRAEQEEDERAALSS